MGVDGVTMPATDKGKLKRCADCSHTKAAHAGKEGECMAPSDDGLCVCETFDHGTNGGKGFSNTTRGQSSFDGNEYIAWSERQDEEGGEGW